MLLDLELARVELLGLVDPVEDARHGPLPLRLLQEPARRHAQRMLGGLLEAHLQHKERRLLLEVLEKAPHRRLALGQVRGGFRRLRRLGLLEGHFGLGIFAHERRALAQGKLGGDVFGRRELADDSVELGAADQMADELVDASHVELAL